MGILDRARAIFKRRPKPITRAYAGGSGFEAAGAGRRFRGSGVIPNLQSAQLASREQVARMTRTPSLIRRILTSRQPARSYRNRPFPMRASPCGCRRAWLGWAPEG
jgi:hypothetical protein